MTRARLGHRLIVTILLLLVGLSAMSLIVLAFGLKISQQQVTDNLEKSTASSRERQAAELAKVRDDSLHQAEQALHDKLMGMATLIASSSVSSLITEDFGVLETACQQAVTDPDAVWTFVCTSEGKAAAEAQDPLQKSELVAGGVPMEAAFDVRRNALQKATGLKVVIAPILIDGKSAGGVTIVASTKRLMAQISTINAHFAQMETTAADEAMHLRGTLVDVQSNAGRRLMATLLMATGLALVLGFFLTLRLARGITRPLVAVGTATAGLAAGDLTCRADVSAKDEVGEMAGSLNASLDHLQHAIQGISGTAHSLGLAAGQLNAISGDMGQAAVRSAGEAQRAAEGTQNLALTLGSVATGITQMGSCVEEIVRNTEQAADVGREAVEMTHQATTAIIDLGHASDQIGGIVQVISEIASRTNLLALNAAIEAASAGESGRGFAVVANEVKELARQTTSATLDIADKVSAIANGSTSATAAITRIAGIVQRINELQQAIASAVTEQAATTREMSEQVHHAAEGGNTISVSIGVVATAAAATTNGAERTNAQAAELTRLAEELRLAVERFRC